MNAHPFAEVLEASGVDPDAVPAVVDLLVESLADWFTREGFTVAAGYVTQHLTSSAAETKS